MSSLKQYIDLYKSNEETLRQNSPALFSAMRAPALSALERFGRFPDRHDEGYSCSSLEKMFEPDYGVNIARVPFAVDMAGTFRCDVPNVSTLLGVVVNDEFRPTTTLIKNCPEGVKVMSLSKAAETYPELVKRYLGRMSDNRNAAAALNTLLMQDGVFIHVGCGCRCDKTIQIVNIFNADISLMSLRRVLVVVENGASARLLLCDHSQNNEHDYLSDSVTEIFLEEGARLEYCDIEESSERTSRISQFYVSQEEGSEFTANISSLTVGHTRNEYYIDLKGRHCLTYIGGMAIGDGKQVVDNSSFVRHLAPECRSNQTFKYLLDDKAQGAFEGLIYVAEGAEKTEAQQNDRNILASTDARMHTAPQLEIYCDDVKCSHGAATGQLDTNALFYMQTRGIPLQQARTMLMQAFMNDVIDKVRIEGLRDRLRHLVERRLSGNKAACGDCAASCHN